MKKKVPSSKTIVISLDEPYDTGIISIEVVARDKHNCLHGAATMKDLTEPYNYFLLRGDRGFEAYRDAEDAMHGTQWKNSAKCDTK